MLILLPLQNKAEAPVRGRRPADDSVPAQGLHENVSGQQVNFAMVFILYGYRVSISAVSLTNPTDYDHFNFNLFSLCP